MPRVGEDIYVCDMAGCGTRVEPGRGHAYQTVRHGLAIICTRCHQEIERERKVA